ncbi:MAG: hypothetical protein ACXWVO_09615 [Caulobacteraceae bacterium]
MGVIRAIVAGFRKVGADMARESAAWRIRCEACGRDRSLRSVGGVRYGAFGIKHTLGFCSGCKTVRPLKIYRPETPRAN